MNPTASAHVPAPFRRAASRLSAAAVSALLLSGSLLSAQTTAPATMPTTAPGVHSTKNITTQPGGLLMINFRDANIDTVLDELSTAAGYNIVKTVRPEGRVSLISGQGVTADGAIQLLNSVLKDKGYVVLQQGKILKTDTVEHARHANIPVRTGSDPQRIDPTDELITQVIPLRYASATQLKQDLTPLVNPGADFTANASSNALIITDTAANIRRVCEIVTALDTHLADATEVQIFKLTNADATSAAKLVNDLFKAPAQTQNNQNRGQGGFPGFRGFGGGGGGGGGGGFGGFGGFGGGGGGGNRGAGGQGQAGGDGSAITSATVNASADDRTNTLVVTGPSDVLKTVAEVVNKLDDNPEAQESVHIFRLKNANAVDVEGTINALINGTTPNRSTSGSQANSNRSSLSGGSSIGGSSSLGGSSSSGGGNRTGGGGGGGGGGFGGQTAGNTNRGGTATSARGGSGTGSGSAASGLLGLGGSVTIIADQDTNSMLVRCSPKNYDLIKPLLEELDRPVAQVLIQVLIAEVSHDNSSDLGAEFSILNLRASGNGQTGGTQFGIPTGAAGTGFVASILETNFQATLRAYEENGKLDVLSRPYILASDNQLASVTIGSTTPYVRNSQITEQGTINNTVQYADIGILLDVIPHINPDGLVTMDVAPTISAQQATSVQISTNVTAPVFSKRSAETHVAVQDGQTIVIGGLMEDRKSETIRKVPLLGDIPIVGNLFRRQQVDKTKTELLIFLTPHVAARADVLQGMGKDALKKTKLVPGAVDAGIFQQHLEGMNSGTPTTDPSEPTTPGDPLAQPGTP